MTKNPVVWGKEAHTQLIIIWKGMTANQDASRMKTHGAGEALKILLDSLLAMSWLLIPLCCMHLILLTALLLLLLRVSHI